MSERTLVNYVLKGMKGRWRKPVKHADAFTEGVPDLSAHIEPIGTVWVELKALKAWPKRPGTRVKFGLSDAQRDFLDQRGGWLLVRVRREYLLFNSAVAQHVVDRPYATAALLINNATVHWRNRIDFKELRKWLMTRK